MTERDMTKVHVSLPNHWMVGGESLWASPVEGEPEHYRIENIPYFAYGVALGDVVRAVRTDDHPREAVEVVRPSGNLVFRVMFDDAVDHERQVEILRALREEHGIGMEKAFDRLWALSVPREAVEAVDERLVALQEERVLDLETGERRVEGSFDADPDEE